jgi:carbamoyl-phosphate synthase large subunit
MESNNILVTAIGSMSASCVLENLHNIKGVKIIGTDIYPIEWQINLEFLEKFYKAPKYNADSYIDFMLELCSLNDIKFIFPLTDAEIDVLNQNRHIFENRKITICISAFETILRCRDKSKIESNISSFSQNELQNTDIYPIIAKPKNGRSSEGKFLLESYTQLSIIKNINDYIFQPYVDGQVITADVIRDKCGNTIFISRKELLRTSNGAGIVVEIFKDVNFIEIVLQIANKLNILGCVNFEFLYYNRIYYLMDVNPRFSAGIGFSCFAGYNFVEEHLRVFQNKEISKLQKFKTGILAKRTNIIQIEGSV